jgi:DNA-binding transcriptional MerR regulator
VAKGPEAFRTISEAADELGVPQHVLRFWESKFSFIRPMKRAGGRRFYRPQDIAVLAGVQRLLHQEGYTIKGVQRLHKEEGMARILSTTPAAPGGKSGSRAPSAAGAPRPAVQGALAQALADLETAKKRLDGLLE